jgi:hypothetical protein
MKKTKKSFIFSSRGSEYSAEREGKFKVLKDKSKLKISRILIIVLPLVFISSSLIGVIAMNDLECIFSEEPEKIVMKDYIISGATEFLLSKSYSDLILMEYEKSVKQAFNFSLVSDYLGKTISALESARDKYIKAKDIGEKLGYIEEKVSWFENFNYIDFINANKLNKDIATEVKSFLAKCDVVGLYQQNIDNIGDILNILYSIKNKVSSNSKPDISSMWKLLQQYSEVLTFGNYSTIIGTKILSNCDD